MGAQSTRECSTRMLIDVLDGATYDGIARAHGVGKTAVEKRIKLLLQHLNRSVGIDGMDDDGLASVVRMRACKPSILGALSRYSAGVPPPAVAGTVSDKQLLAGAQRTRARSDNPHRDVAMLFFIFSTGAKPIEIARVEVRDYLTREGGIRRVSEWRAESAVGGIARPLFFKSIRTCEAIDGYLRERSARRLGAATTSEYRGLDPRSRLFLTEDGRPFEVIEGRPDTSGRHLCRGILAAYGTIFKRANLWGMNTRTARRTVAQRLRERGADDSQIAELLGIRKSSTLRQFLGTMRRPLEAVMTDIV